DLIAATDNPMRVCPGIVNNTKQAFRWKLKQGDAEAEVLEAARQNETTFRLELDTSDVYANGVVELTEPEVGEKRYTLSINTVVDTTHVTVIGHFDKANVCTRIGRSGVLYEWTLCQGNYERKIQSVTEISKNEYNLRLTAACANFVPGPVYLFE